MVDHSRARLYFLIPGALWVLAFTIFPLLYGLYLSFFNVQFGKPNQFVGLGNYARFFGDPAAWNSVRVTLLFLVGGVTTQVVLGLLVALLVNRRLLFRPIFRTMLVLPLFATPVAVGFLFFTIFYEEGGLINSLLNIRVPWLSNPSLALVSVIIADSWQWTSFCFIILLAALQGIPPDMYEAAALETKNPWKVFWNITYPYLQPTLVLVVLLRITEGFKVFAIPYTLTRGGPGRATQVLPMLAHRAGMRYFDFGYAAAISFMMFIFVMIFIVLLFRQIRQAN